MECPHLGAVDWAEYSHRFDQGEDIRVVGLDQTVHNQPEQTLLLFDIGGESHSAGALGLRDQVHLLRQAAFEYGYGL